MTNLNKIQNYIKNKPNKIDYTVYRITAFYEESQAFNGTVCSFIEPNEHLSLEQIMDFPNINFEEKPTFTVIDSQIYCQAEQIDLLKRFFPLLMCYMREDDYQQIWWSDFTDILHARYTRYFGYASLATPIPENFTNNHALQLVKQLQAQRPIQYGYEKAIILIISPTKDDAFYDFYLQLGHLLQDSGLISDDFRIQTEIDKTAEKLELYAIFANTRLSYEVQIPDDKFFFTLD